MANEISYIPQRPLIPITDPQKTSGKKSVVDVSKSKEGVSFDALLEKEIKGKTGLEFSAHAKQRLENRNINITSNQMDRILNAVDKAATKGSKDSLLLVDDFAAVVSVKNRTVITVVDGQSVKDNVFTNIDSAVIA